MLKMGFSHIVNPADHLPARITNSDKDFDRKLDFKGIKLPVKIKDIHKIGKKITPAFGFLFMKIRKNIQLIYHLFIINYLSIIDRRRR